MTARLKAFGAGIAIAFLAMSIYALALGCFIALMLLVIAMEEGGSSLSDATMPLTEAIVLLGQGVGYAWGPITLTITPLLLTGMLIALVGTLAARIGTSPVGFVGGEIAWAVMNLYAFSGVAGMMINDRVTALAKCALIFGLGYLAAAFPSSNLAHMVKSKVWDPISFEVRRAVLLGVIAFAFIALMLLVAGIVTVIVWIVMNYDGMLTLFRLMDMGIGSRIVTTVACLAWLPNMVLWALSWLSGAGFAIGELATFSLWAGGGDGLPSLPVFGLLPQPIDDDLTRMLVMGVPYVIALTVGIYVIVGKLGFGIRSQLTSGDRETISKGAVIALTYPAASFCLAAALISLFATLCFAISDGSLGTGRLKHIGVEVVQSTQAVGHGVALGLLSAWLCALVGVGLYFGIRWVAMRVRQRRHPASDENDINELATTTTTKEKE